MMRRSNGLHLDIPANTAAIYISILKAKKISDELLKESGLFNGG